MPETEPALPPASKTRERLLEIDFFRGLIMVLMTLDHTRDFFMRESFDPTDLAKTYPGLFLTRWITHFCAPGFVFLAGISAYLASRKRTAAEMTRFLMTRGLWLVFLELTVIRVAWFFRLDWQIYYGGVIWAIGWSMFFLGLLVWLPGRLLWVFSLAMVLFHNAFDGVAPSPGFQPIWTFLHQPGEIKSLSPIILQIWYPLIPWVAVMALGYCLAKTVLAAGLDRGKFFRRIGTVCVFGFILLRWTNLYGDPMPWKPQANELFTIFSILNCTKYPPSLCYLLMTLGPLFLGLGCWKPTFGWLQQIFVIFGRVPLFFYLIHIYLIHGMARMWVYIWEGPVDFENRVPGPLSMVYLMWVVTVLILYPACHWFSKIKERNRHWLLSYL